MAKGAGMIHPNMATMLSVVVTDAAVSPAALDAALPDRRRRQLQLYQRRRRHEHERHRAGAGERRRRRGGPGTFASALTGLCADLAQQIVRDGEGATKFITIRVIGAASDTDARLAAKAVANSPLVKTAFYGGDANWGRILAAVGYSGATVNPARADLWIAPGSADAKQSEGRLQLVGAGRPLAYSEDTATAIFAAGEIAVSVELGLGDGNATVWTCDLSHDVRGHQRTLSNINQTEASADASQP